MSFCSWAKQEIHRDNFSSGMYVCSQCDYPLFSRFTNFYKNKNYQVLLWSSEKYKHHTPWPAFKNPVHPDSLSKKIEDEAQDSSEAFAYKISCGKCGNPLGHEFLKDGPDGVGSRFWIFRWSLLDQPAVAEYFMFQSCSEVHSWAREQVRRGRGLENFSEWRQIHKSAALDLDWWERIFTSLLKYKFYQLFPTVSLACRHTNTLLMLRPA